MFRKTTFLLLIISVFSINLFGQPKVDSLKSLLKTKIADTTRILALDQLALGIFYKQPIEALEYANEGLELANKVDFKKGKVRILNRLGAIYRRNNNFPKALKYNYEAISIAEEIEDYEGLGRVYNNLSIFYSVQSDYKKALEFDYKLKRLAEKTKDQKMLENAFHNIGSDFISLNKLDSAKYYLEKVHKLDKKNDRIYDSFISLSNLAIINSKAKKYDLAISQNIECIAYFKKNKIERSIIKSYQNLAEIYFQTNKLDLASYYGKLAFEISQANMDIKETYISSNNLSKIYEKNDPKLALEYLKIANTFRDSLFNIEKIEQLQVVDFQEKERKQELIDAQKELENRLKYGLLIAALAALLLITYIQYRNNKQKNLTNNKLNEQNNAIQNQKLELETSLEKLKITQKQLVQQEKLASLGELTAGIAHEIQNPLNFVNNFSEVNEELIAEIKEEQAKNTEKRDLELEKELLTDLANNQSKILMHGKRASSIVRAMLDHARNSTGDRTLINLNNIADEFLKLSYLGMKSKYKNFEAIYELEEEENLPEIMAVSQDISRVILNLINNAFYAVYERKNKKNESDFHPKISVFTKYWPDLKMNGKTGFVELSVKDNGSGIDDALKEKIFQPFFTTKPAGEGTGLGLSLSYDIITKGHGGSLEVNSEMGSGSLFKITLPING